MCKVSLFAAKYRSGRRGKMRNLKSDIIEINRIEFDEPSELFESSPSPGAVFASFN